jgi:hypothetical protein
MELRCSNKLHGIVVEPGSTRASEHAVIEVKCDSKFCGAGSGAVVLHRFDIATQKLIGTSKYKDPQKELKQ